jgi:TPR repeat protein
MGGIPFRTDSFMKQFSPYLSTAVIFLAVCMLSACSIINDPAAPPPSAGGTPNHLAVLFPNETNFPTDPVAAANWIKTKSDAGDPAAKYALGWANYLGAGVPKDQPLALQLFAQAAAQGSDEALLSLGFLQYDTPLINGDAQLAPKPDLQAYQQAADKGDELAQEILREHKNSMPEPPSAHLMQWYRKLANLGVPAAQVLLGRYNLIGYGGLEKNSVQAIVWFTLADAQGNGAADANLGQIYIQGDGVPKDVPLGLTFLKKGANRGAPLALSVFGQMTAGGENAPKNEVEGLAMMYAAQAMGTVADPIALSDLEKSLDSSRVAAARKRSEEILGPEKLQALKPAP